MSFVQIHIVQNIGCYCFLVPKDKKSGNEIMKQNPFLQRARPYLAIFDKVLLVNTSAVDRSRDRRWSRSESIVLARVGVGAGVDKIWPTPTPAWSQWLTQAADDNFGLTVLHPPENIERMKKGRVAVCR